MLFSLSAAAKAVGKGKSTLHNAIRAGRLSAIRNDDGTYSIDASELARVYGLNGLNPLNRPSMDVGEPPAEPQRTELAVLRTKVGMLEDQLAWERETTGRTVEDLRRRLDRAEERVLALTAQPASQPAPEVPAVVEELRRRLEEAEARNQILSAVVTPQRAEERPSEAAAGTTPAKRTRSFLGRLLGR